MVRFGGGGSSNSCNSISMSRSDSAPPAPSAKVYTFEASTKWLTFCKQHFQIQFLERKCLYFNSNFTEVCSQGYNGSCNGLVPYRQQAITRTNVDKDFWCLMASLGHEFRAQKSNYIHIKLWDLITHTITLTSSWSQLIEAERCIYMYVSPI